MRIGELAARTGIGVETIRFYEAKGLLPAANRLPNNYRVYDEKHVARLHFIRHCRALDIGLDDVAKLCAVDNSPGQYAHVHDLIDMQLSAVKKRIAELLALQMKLEELKGSCTGEHSCGDCAIMTGLENYDDVGHDCCRHFVDKDALGTKNK